MSSDIFATENIPNDTIEVPQLFPNADMWTIGDNIIVSIGDENGDTLEMASIMIRKNETGLAVFTYRITVTEIDEEDGEVSKTVYDPTEDRLRFIPWSTITSVTLKDAERRLLGIRS